jgi:predicted DNA-binding protein
MEATNNFQAAETSRVAVRLPPFWAERPALWFTQAESLFSLASISNERTKFYHIISQLDRKYAAEVEDFSTASEPLHRIKDRAAKSPVTHEQRARQIITHKEMGDRKPSQFLRHLRSLAPDCQSTSCEAYGAAGYHATYKQFSLASLRSD